VEGIVPEDPTHPYRYKAIIWFTDAGPTLLYEIEAFRLWKISFDIDWADPREWRD
jgi:hypothetical protein